MVGKKGIRDMKNPLDDRQRFLKALIEYAEKSEKFNPHFQKRELMAVLNVKEGEFNIMQKKLGNKYCHFVDVRDGDDRYEIHLNECLSLKEQYDEAEKQERRHWQIVWLVVITTIIGAFLAVALTKWLL